MMKVEPFLQMYFPNLKLEPPLFYNWPIGIRFEIGLPPTEPLPLYLSGCYERSIRLFDEINKESDQLIIVMDIFNKKVGRRNILPYVKDKNNKTIQLKQIAIEEGFIHRFTFTGTKHEIYYKRLLKKICEKDFTSFLGGKDYCVYFINVQKKTIYYLYDV